MKVGRIISTALLGFLLFLFVGIDLVLFGVVAFDSIVLTLFPFLGLVVGTALRVVVSKRRISTT